MKYYVSLTGAQPEHQTGKWEVSACVLTLGRGDSADIKLPDSGRVISRQQGRLQLGADARPTWYQDGANPSLINGQPVCMLQHRALQAGDRIQVGHYELCIETDCHAAPHALSFHTGSAWPGLGEAACLSIDDLLSEPAHQQPAPHTGAQVHQSSGFFEVLGHRHDIPFLELQHGTQAEWQQAGLSGQEHPQAHAEPRTDVQSALIPLLEGMGLPADTPPKPSATACRWSVPERCHRRHGEADGHSQPVQAGNTQRTHANYSDPRQPFKAQCVWRASLATSSGARQHSLFFSALPRAKQF
ncbi:MAG: FHA domain-containing protein [Limnobacter sp.]|nr:FHA domain-containing protein [Limnobacter sp.]